MDGQFVGKTALVVGVGKATGREIAKALAAGGATVHGISRTQADLDSLQQEIPGIILYNLDVSDWEKTRTLIADIGPLDMLINNVGPYMMKEFLNVGKEDLYGLFAKNVFAAFNISQVVGNRMVAKNEGGSVVNISGYDALRPFPNASVYCMTKAAVDMMTKCMALELGKHKIRVNSVSPGIINTPVLLQLKESSEELRDQIDTFTSKVPFYKKESEMADVVNAVLFLLSDKAATITGCCLPIDGGASM